MPPSTGGSGGWCGAGGGWCGAGGGSGAGGISGPRAVRGADCADDPEPSFRGDPGSISSRQGLTINSEATTSRVSQSAKGLRLNNTDTTAKRKMQCTTHARDFLHISHEGEKYSAAPRGSNNWGGEGQVDRKGGESMILSGMRFILLGFPSNLRIECRDKIIHMGGKLLPSTDYDIATHIVLMEEFSAGANLIWRTDGKKVVKKIWIDQCCRQGRVLDEKVGGVPAIYETPTKTCSIEDEQRPVVSTSKKLRQCCHDTSFNTKGLKRRLLASESETSRLGDELNYSSYHHWYHCKLDSSSSINLEQWAIDNKENVTSLITTPGSGGRHYSLVTSNELKLNIRKAFDAVLFMNNDHLTLRGNFSAKNFLIDGSHLVRIGNVEEGSLQVYTGDSDKKSDYHGFVKMVNKELFHGKGKPDDITQWLGLVLAAKVDSELLKFHFSLMEGRHAAEVLMSLNDLLLGLEVSDHAAYKQVLLDLAKYKGWQKKCQRMTCFLNDTVMCKDPKTGRFMSTYTDDVRGLLKLIQNCRQHTAKYEEEFFSCIVGQLCPNFMADFQHAMSRAGYLKKLNLQYVMV